MSGTSLPDDAPDAATRKRILWALAIFLLVQLTVPLTYYLRDDRYDERFAWRMFSAIRVQRCETIASEVRSGVSRTIPLSRIHSAWVEHLRRNRLAVIDRFLEDRCTLGASSVRLMSYCTDGGGRHLPARTYALRCEGGAR